MHFDSDLLGRRVALSESVACELRMLAIEGLTALRRRGLEVGGILLGHATKEQISVEGFQEVPCEHRYGPSYALSDTDREKLTESLTQPRGGGMHVVGMFRSFTGRDPVVEPDDEALAAQHFQQGDFALLLLQPLSAEKCVATWRVFRDGQLLAADDKPPFVLGRQPVPVPLEPIVAPEPAIEPVPKHTRVPLPVAAIALDPEPAPRRSPLWQAAVICMAVVLAGSLAYELGRTQRPLPSSSPKWAELNLEARPAGGKLEVSWDSKMAQAIRATRGALTIRDGAVHREVELSPEEVAAGRYIYDAERPDVAIRLTLSADNRTLASESTRLTAPPVTTPQPEITPSAVAPAVTAESAPEVAPSVAHEVQPSVSEGIRSRIKGQIALSVQVEVNEHGRVVAAKTKDPGADGLRRYLGGLAEKAAREWRFTPARNRAGKPVGGSKTIQFVFTANTVTVLALLNR